MKFIKEELAIAEIKGREDYKDLKGTIKFIPIENKIRIKIDLINLPPNKFLGFHIHNKGKCEGDEKDPFKKVGKHYNPSKQQHPQHKGDLPPLYTSDGEIHNTIESNRFTIDEIIGKGIIIHSQEDDFKSQPAGNAGEKIACGEIKGVDMKLKLQESISWDYYNQPKFMKIENKYLPDIGEGETMAEQIVTATTKLVYKHYNDGDVFDNVNSNLNSWNDLSDYANWLYYNARSTKHILKKIYRMSSEDKYKELLKELVDLTNNEEYLKDYANKPKFGTIYDQEGPFEYIESYDDGYNDYDEEEYWDDQD